MPINPNERDRYYTLDNYSYSFSGADARAYFFFDGAEQDIRSLDAMQTISLSIHEGKGQARALGHRGVKGFSRSLRTIGGSMIMTVVNDHPLRPIMLQVEEYLRQNDSFYPGWSLDRDEIGTGTALDAFDYRNRIAGLIPPFNLIVSYVSEGGNYFTNVKDRDKFGSDAIARIEGASLLIREIEIVDSGIVTSTHDIISEMTFSFMARDVKPLSAVDFRGNWATTSADPKVNLDKEIQNRLGLTRTVVPGQTRDAVLIQTSNRNVKTNPEKK
jgi:hypothetical protein